MEQKCAYPEFDGFMFLIFVIDANDRIHEMANPAFSLNLWLIWA